MTLAAYLAELHDAGRASSSASMAVAAACFRAKLAGQPAPAGERTAWVLAGYRRTASDRGRGQARPFGGSNLAAVLATCHRPRRRGRGIETEEVAAERGRVDAVIAGLLFMAGMRRSEVSALWWADVADSTDGDGMLVTVRRMRDHHPSGGSVPSQQSPGPSARTHAAPTPARCGGLDAWLDGRELHDVTLAAYLAELHDAGRASSSASMAVAAACFRAKLAGQPAPAGERTARVLAGYRRTAGDRGRGQARPFGVSDLAAVLATCHRQRRRGRGVESEEVALERGRVDAVIAGLLFMAGMRRSEVSALRWADVVDSTDGDGILITVRRSKTNQEGEVNDVRFSFESFPRWWPRRSLR